MQMVTHNNQPPKAGHKNMRQPRTTPRQELMDTGTGTVSLQRNDQTVDSDARPAHQEVENSGKV